MAYREKQIQIPETLFVQMATFVMTEEYRTEQNTKTIISGIYAKLDRQIEHDLYTRSKTAPTQEQKEKARLEYLEHKGIHPSFRW